MKEHLKQLNMLIEQAQHKGFKVNMSDEDNSLFQAGVMAGWVHFRDLIESISEEANADAFKEAEVLIASPESLEAAIDSRLILHKLNDLLEISTEILSMLTLVKQEDSIEAAGEIEEINNNFTLEDSTLEFLKGIASSLNKEDNENETAEDNR